jgi:hypothetical protein
MPQGFEGPLPGGDSRTNKQNRLIAARSFRRPATRKASRG